MHISEVRIVNFRCFDSFGLKLDPGLNVVVGENNSGKTSLLDSIRLVLSTSSGDWLKISDFDFHNQSTEFTIQLKFDAISPEQASVFVEHLTYEGVAEGKRKPVLYVNLKANKTDITRRGNLYIRTEIKSGKEAEGPTIEWEIRNYLAATYLKPLRDAEAELSSGKGSRLAQILSASKAFDRGGTDFQGLLEGLIEASNQAKSNHAIESNKSSIIEQFQKLIFTSDLDKFNLAIQMLGTTPFDRMSKTEKERAFQDILQKLSLTLDESKPQQGLGYNNVLFMATELILLNNEKDRFALLLIEEPEAHLHPQLQMKFLSFVNEWYDTGKASGIQTILTTHSPNLASKAPLDSLILMKDYKAFPLRKGETGLAPDDYVFLEKFLDVTKANLLFARAVLIVEGDAENILIPTIAKLLNRSLEDYGVSIINVGSTAYARYAKIFLRAKENTRPENWLPIKVACIRDLDLWPEKADKEVPPRIGFKELNMEQRGNRHFWLPRTAPDGTNIGTAVELKKRKLKRIETERETQTELVLNHQHIRVEVSDEWTFEYCLIKNGLGEEIYSIVAPKKSYADLLEDEEEKAIQIYKLVDGLSAKTDVAYNLSIKLMEQFSTRGQKEALKAKIPTYILNAIEYVTEPFPANLDESPATQAAIQNAAPQTEAQ